MAIDIFRSPDSSCHFTHQISKCLRAKPVIGFLKDKSVSANLKLLLPLYSNYQVGIGFRQRQSRTIDWFSRIFVDNSGSQSSTGDEEGGTRLIRTIKAFLNRAIKRIKEIRIGLPMKLLFFLVGFYCATAFSTVIGQTGDWDILSAGLAVVIVESIGAVMYRASLPLFDKLKTFIAMFNYWKVGLCLGLFLDAFKY